MVFADQRQLLALFFAPRRGLAVEEVDVGAAVELVDVCGVDPVLQTVVLDLNPPDRLIVVLLFVTVADTKRF